MSDEFLSEPLTPVTETADTARMARGEPGLPRQFVWRGETVEIVEVRRAWHDTGPCSSGSDERYVRRHWYEVDTAGHGRLTIYFQRQARAGRGSPRWWLFSRSRAGAES